MQNALLISPITIPAGEFGPMPGAPAGCGLAASFADQVLAMTRTVTGPVPEDEATLPIVVAPFVVPAIPGMAPDPAAEPGPVIDPPIPGATLPSGCRSDNPGAALTMRLHQGFIADAPDQSPGPLGFAAPETQPDPSEQAARTLPPSADGPSRCPALPEDDRNARLASVGFWPLTGPQTGQGAGFSAQGSITLPASSGPTFAGGEGNVASAPFRSDDMADAGVAGPFGRRDPVAAEDPIAVSAPTSGHPSAAGPSEIASVDPSVGTAAGSALTPKHPHAPAGPSGTPDAAEIPRDDIASPLVSGQRDPDRTGRPLRPGEDRPRPDAPMPRVDPPAHAGGPASGSVWQHVFQQATQGPDEGSRVADGKAPVAQPTDAALVSMTDSDVPVPAADVAPAAAQGPIDPPTEPRAKGLFAVPDVGAARTIAESPAAGAWTDGPLVPEPDPRTDPGPDPWPDGMPGPSLPGPVFGTAGQHGARLDPASPVIAHVAGQLAAVLRHESSGETELALSPVELGRVRLRLEPDAAQPDRLVILITVERPETLELFRRHAGELAEALRNAGYSGSTIDFAQGGEDRSAGGGKGDQGQRAPPTPEELPVIAAPVRHRLGSSLDLRV